MFASLQGRVCIVTGGSKGIGRGLARRFGAVGCHVVVAARDAGPGAHGRRTRSPRHGGSAIAVAADVADPASMEALAQAAVERFGGIDILCANAGIFPAAKLGADDRRRLRPGDRAPTSRAPSSRVTACLPAMKARRRGRVVVTSSITGPITGYPGWAHYGASKAGQLGFVRTAAIELAPFGITINAVMPGNVMTEGLDGLGQDYLDRMTASIPMRRLGSVDDIANAALFFASDEAAYVTGQTLVVDGGQVLPESLAALEEMAS